MKLRFGADGLVDGGIECVGRGNADEYEVETVYDLTDWLRRQFVALRREAESNQEEAFTHIWIGGGQMPFGMIRATTSKYTAYCVHPEIRDGGDSSLESSDINKVGAFLANKAMRVSDLTWQPKSNTN